MRRQHAPLDSSGNVVARLPKIPLKSSGIHQIRGLCDFSIGFASVLKTDWVNRRDTREPCSTAATHRPPNTSAPGPTRGARCYSGRWRRTAWLSSTSKSEGEPREGRELLPTVHLVDWALWFVHLNCEWSILSCNLNSPWISTIYEYMNVVLQWKVLYPAW